MWDFRFPSGVFYGRGLWTAEILTAATRCSTHHASCCTFSYRIRASPHPKALTSRRRLVRNDKLFDSPASFRAILAGQAQARPYVPLCQPVFSPAGFWHCVKPYSDFDENTVHFLAIYWVRRTGNRRSFVSSAQIIVSSRKKPKRGLQDIWLFRIICLNRTHENVVLCV